MTTATESRTPSTTSSQDTTQVKLQNIELLLDQSRGARAELCRRLGKGDNLFSLLRQGILNLDRELESAIVRHMQIPAEWPLSVPHTEKDLPVSMAGWITDKTQRMGKVAVQHVYHRAPEVPVPVQPSAQGQRADDIPRRRQADSLGPLANALLLKVKDHAINGSLSEELSLKMLNLLMDSEGPKSSH